MKPELSSTRSRYRNEVVYRSAERLLASRPKPARGGPKIWPLVFLIGFVCGVGLTTLWFLPLRTVETSPRRPTKPAPAKSPANVSKDDARFARRSPLPAAPRENTTSIDAVDNTPPATTESERAAAPSANRAFAIVPAQPSAVRATPTVVATTLHFASLLVLHGHQFAEFRPPQEVHFLLYPARGPRGVTVVGSVRYFENGTMVSFHPLTGSIDNLTIHLKEVTTFVRGRQAIPLRFDISIPRELATSRFQGTWSHGTERGQLELELLQPF